MIRSSLVSRIAAVGCLTAIAVVCAVLIARSAPDAAEFGPCPTDSTKVTQAGFGPCLSLYLNGRTISGSDYEALPDETKQRTVQVGDIVAVFDRQADWERFQDFLPDDPREVAKPGFSERLQTYLEQMPAKSS